VPTFSTLLGVFCMAAAPVADLAKSLPAEVIGYTPASADETADRDGMFRLIDGGAEVYLALNVRGMLERTYAKKNAPDIIVDLFDMGSSADAFGAYHYAMREGRSVGVGVESELHGNTLAFWKGRLFVSIVPLRVIAGIGDVVLALGQSIAKGIKEQGGPPALVRLLPRQGLVASQVHYFHDGSLLRMRAALASVAVLGLTAETEGLLARYRLSDDTASAAGATGAALLLIRYPTDAGARAAFAALRTSPTSLDAAHTVEARLAGRLLAAVLDAPSPAAARALLDALPQEGKAVP